MKILTILLVLVHPCLLLAAESSDAREQQLEEAIGRRIDAIKSKIKREIERRQHVHETEENNAKYDGLMQQEQQCPVEVEVKGSDMAKEKTENADGKIRRKRDRDDDEIKQNLRKIQEEDDFLRKLGDANNDPTGVGPGQPDFLFRRENNSQAPVAASRAVRKRNADRGFSKFSELQRRRRTPFKQRRRRRHRQRRPVKLEPVVNVASSRFKRV